MTLFVCGFPAERGRFDDDFPGERLTAQIDALAALRAGRFALQVGGLDSFASAPFLTVGDPEKRLEALRAALAAHSVEIRQAPYHAHITVGLYARAVPRQALQQRLSGFADVEPLTLPIHELHYSTYAASELAGPLRVEHRLALCR